MPSHKLTHSKPTQSRTNTPEEDSEEDEDEMSPDWSVVCWTRDDYMAVLRNGDKLCVGADRFLRILGIGEFNIDKYYYCFFFII